MLEYLRGRSSISAAKEWVKFWVRILDVVTDTQIKRLLWKSDGVTMGEMNNLYNAHVYNLNHVSVSRAIARLQTILFSFGWRPWKDGDVGWEADFINNNDE